MYICHFCGIGQYAKKLGPVLSVSKNEVSRIYTYIYIHAKCPVLRDAVLPL